MATNEPAQLIAEIMASDRPSERLEGLIGALSETCHALEEEVGLDGAYRIVTAAAELLGEKRARGLS